jgi:hypothetical protein
VQYSSDAAFDAPYGEIGAMSALCVIGNVPSIPYTAADEANTTCSAFSAFAVCAYVKVSFLRYASRLSGYAQGTRLFADCCGIMASHPDLPQSR